MSNALFSSSLAQYLSNYLALRRSLGYEMRHNLFVLRQFDRAVAAGIQSPEPVSRDIIEEYLRSLAHVQPNTRRLRLSTVRQFLLYLRRFEPATFVPDRSMEPAHTASRRIPYIFTENEICKLIRAAYGHPARQKCRRWLLYPTLLGLLYVTGMRVREALQLKLEDLDLRERILRIRKAKFHKARLVPLAESTCAAVKRYLMARAERGHPTAAGAHLFVTDRGNRLPYASVWKVFHLIAHMAGIEGKARPIPRIHDLRHTMAVRRLYLWYHEGKNVQALLPVLSTFLGHSTVSGTAIYLTTTAELLAEANLRLKKHLGDPACKKGGF
jgi:site-specific recombinase XerD